MAYAAFGMCDADNCSSRGLLAELIAANDSPNNLQDLLGDQLHMPGRLQARSRQGVPHSSSTVFSIPLPRGVMTSIVPYFPVLPRGRRFKGEYRKSE